MPQTNDVSRSEPVLFLTEAADAMEAYHARHGHYADEWNVLDMTFAGGPYRITDPGVRPGKTDRKRWRPRDCEYTYEIVSATKSAFLIQAKNRDSVTEYEMRQGMSEPVRLTDAPCTIEVPKDKILPEPAMFLNAAAVKFVEYRQHHGAYPKTWEALGFHWSLQAHTTHDPAALPPANIGPVWKPLGAHYSYVIEKATAADYKIRSRNDQGLPDMQITAAAPVPVLVKVK